MLRSRLEWAPTLFSLAVCLCPAVRHCFSLQRGLGDLGPAGQNLSWGVCSSGASWPCLSASWLTSQGRWHGSRKEDGIKEERSL